MNHSAQAASVAAAKAADAATRRLDAHPVEIAVNEADRMAMAMPSLNEADIAGVDLPSDVGIILKGRIRTRPQARRDVPREFNRRLKPAFEARGSC